MRDCGGAGGRRGADRSGPAPAQRGRDGALRGALPEGSHRRPRPTPTCGPLEERLQYLRELDERRRRFCASIEAQGQLTPELQAAVDAADHEGAPRGPLPSVQAEDSAAAPAVARDAGLEPLADALLADPSLAPEVEADALRRSGARRGGPGRGARRRPVDPDRAVRRGPATLLDALRQYVLGPRTPAVEGRRGASRRRGRSSPTTSTLSEPVTVVPSHRALAMFRGRKEGRAAARARAAGPPAGAPVQPARPAEASPSPRLPEAGSAVQAAGDAGRGSARRAGATSPRACPSR